MFRQSISLRTCGKLKPSKKNANVNSVSAKTELLLPVMEEEILEEAVAVTENLRAILDGQRVVVTTHPVTVPPGPTAKMKEVLFYVFFILIRVADEVN